MSLEYACDCFTKSIFKRVMANEEVMSKNRWASIDAETAFGIVSQLNEYARNSLVLRTYANGYNLTDDTDANESVGAHTNLTRAVMDRALSFLFGPECDRCNIPGGYSYREVAEAIGRHDLPENSIGDQPDNGTFDEEAKHLAECKWHSTFSHQSPSYEIDFEKNVRHLLQEMETRRSPIGKMLHLADKVAAIIMTLVLDTSGKPPKMRKDNKNASERDQFEMYLCDYCEDDACFASEMWTIDYFKCREFVKEDEDGFFTAIVIMATLIAKGSWYNWRIHDYEAYFKP